ncbi:tRNA pseudouridine(38-40) synthase TruA [Sporanaerobium hydrogeniformans]|uniref:tRNA pseudouridine(38-40) synthase TruA n=1 Tax=Sporanaerobium hydrogeniformans TaxID=3072179 RepID=A0AC61DF78_9FIRM|nr:tRNA pseudouridine(38-40) synthase TruA [Sporanaerobium hydrogeniformans]PHV71859.1 tRNA pseudouridine(38-40) synthase TruA [Sporanaerobium hydrogeniformans]
MRNFKMIVQYDGSRYKGFQLQKDTDLTVQHKLEAVLEKMAEEKVSIIGCERTDAGIHAENYVANFKTECHLSPECMLDYCYEFLPEDIVVKSIEEVDERFHARYNVKAKTYGYTINCAAQRNVFERKYVHHMDETFDLENMEKVAAVFKGTHDFQSFTSLKPNGKSTMQTINEIEINQVGNRITIQVTADDFLLHMPRMMIGALIEAGKGTVTAEQTQYIMDKKQRAAGYPMAKPKAMCLLDVRY